MINYHKQMIEYPKQIKGYPKHMTKKMTEYQNI